MPKALFVDPRTLFESRVIGFTDIPVNAYSKTLDEERLRYSDPELLTLYRDMATIREFENMLHALKTRGEYADTTCNYTGPAHLSIGQEAGAVGQAFHLDKHDFIFGSHRSHGEFIAKALSCIRKLEEAELEKLLAEFHGGQTRAAIRNILPGDIRDAAAVFALYGLLSEILGKVTGFNKGLGGSMHAFCPPFGIYPNNAIVGGGADIAAGAALYKKITRRKGIVIANLGDGAATCGNVWEAFHLAAMDQYDLLWGEGYRGGLPILFNFFNNQYSMGDQPSGETTGLVDLVRIGAGIAPDQLHAERINGNDPLAVMDATLRRKELLLGGEGPALLDVVTYRLSGHSPSDPSSYRTREELAAWEQYDPLERYGRKLAGAGICTTGELEAITANTRALLAEICRAACDEILSPRMDLERFPRAIEDLMFSNGRRERMADGEGEVLMALAENPRMQGLAQKSRSGREKGRPLPANKRLQVRDALFEALLEAFHKDPSLIAYGEGVRDWGGAFAVYRGLMDSLPYHRLFNAPIAEGAIVGSAVGYGMAGGRVVVEIMYCDFIGRAGDQILNQLSKWQAMSAGLLKMPVVVRVSIGSKYGAQHSQDWTSLVAHIPGLKVVYPVTPYDAKGLMNAALTGTDPVIFFESQALYDTGELFRPGGVPRGFYTVEIGDPDLKRAGKDLTLLSVGAVLYRVLEAARILEARHGLSAEVIDARSLVPFEYAKVLASVRKTGRILVVGDACERGSMLNDFARNIGEQAFDDLDAPPGVLGAKNWITPPSELEKFYFPQPDSIIQAIHEKIVPLGQPR